LPAVSHRVACSKWLSKTARVDISAGLEAKDVRLYLWNECSGFQFSDGLPDDLLLNLLNTLEVLQPPHLSFEVFCKMEIVPLLR
jgi:hypothetical protein